MKTQYANNLREILASRYPHENDPRRSPAFWEGSPQIDLLAAILDQLYEIGDALKEKEKP